MKISAISNNYVFLGNNKENTRRENVDRAATLQDLHEMEDRINAHNDKLIQTQNANFQNTMQALINILFYPDVADDYNDSILYEDA